MLSKLKPYRFLLCVYGLTLAVAAWENFGSDEPANLMLDDDNFADVVWELYPDKVEAHMLKYRQADLCRKRLRSGGRARACEQYEGQDLEAVIRQHFKLAFKADVKKEAPYYDYLKFLIETGADQVEIDAAYAQWRRRFPLSRETDPRARPLLYEK